MIRLFMARNISKMIVMIRHILMSEFGTALRPTLTADMLANAAPAAGADVTMEAA